MIKRLAKRIRQNPDSDSQEQNLAHAAIRGTLWEYASFFSGKLLVFVSTIILARLLTKDEFGVVGFGLVAISFLDVLRDLGIGSALIYYPEDPEANDTGFWLSVGMGFFLFGATWVAAPLVGDFFHDARAVPITRALAVTFPITALGNVHSVLLSKQLAFGRRFVPDLLQAFAKGLTSVGTALVGFGAASLVMGQIASATVATGAYWWVLPWRPRFRFVRSTARKLLAYGVNIMSHRIIHTALTNADYLLVGRILGSEALGAYTIAFRIPELVIIQFCNSVARVVFPVFSKLQDDPQALGRGFLLTMRYVTLITVPLGLGLALVAEPFVFTFFGEKWAEAVPVVRAISILALFLSLAWNAGDVYKAQGRPEILTIISLARAAVLIPALWWAATTFEDIAAVGWTHAVVALVAGVLQLGLVGVLLHLPASKILKALLPAVAASLPMALATVGVLVLTVDLMQWARLALSVLAGSLTYAAVLWWFQRDVVMRGVDTLRDALLAR